MMLTSKLLLQVPDGIIETVTEQIPKANPTTMVGYSLLVIALSIAIWFLVKENRKLREYQEKIAKKDLEFKQEFVSILTSVKMHIGHNSEIRDANKELLQNLNNSLDNIDDNIKQTLAILRNE